VTDRLAVSPDRTSRSVRPRPITFGLVAIGVVCGAIGVATWSGPPTILALAILGTVALDAAFARSALARLDLTITNPMDAIAGQRVIYVVQARGLTRPVQLVKPADWPIATRRAIGLDAPDAGSIELSAPGRGVLTHLVFDLVATGPVGLWDATCRVRVWFPSPLAVGPAPLAHDPDWPALRTLPLGETESVARGDDLFRGVRPYVRGDARRSVHWPATAHHGTLMVREHDGLEQVAIRIVVHLPLPGLASEYAAARAAWMVEQALMRGWLVHLVTVERAQVDPLPPPLVRPRGPVPFPYPVPVPTVTVDQRIDHPGVARQQLARATYGEPALDRWNGLTRYVSAEGDRWR
jgi:uncharacterized protein (DUF58 family)